MSVLASVASLLLATQVAQATPATGKAAIAQQRAAVAESERLMAEAQKKPGLLAQYLYMRDARARNPDVQFRLIFNQYLSWFQTFVGDYAGARTMFAVSQPLMKGDSGAPMDGGYTAEPALEAITAAAKGRKAVFFNENHSIAQTRTLTVQMLEKLRADGYNTFAAETLYHDDKDLAKRGYPNSDTGFYTEEPIYAEMVRTALKLGYKVVAYEAESMAMGDAREREQARNLYTRTFAQDPNTRLVVNAGFMHIQKSGKFFDGQAMAQHFATLSGVEPLTVDQTVLIPHEKPIDDHPVYRRIAQDVRFDAPVVFRNASNALWSLRPTVFDISVAFPTEVYRRGRPTWAGLDGLRGPYTVTAEICKDAFPCLIEARYADEGEDAIPADRLVFDPYSTGIAVRDRVRTSSDVVPTSELYLRPGRYRISARDAGNHLLGSTSIQAGAETNR
ncbi:MAG: hypothetical protein GXC76_11470 [Rhodanobacteraceae bacterium]|jgi:hypothetical protein|nr:hypothetical protein [Rhodanobacteraceae bacterium]